MQYGFASTYLHGQDVWLPRLGPVSGLAPMTCRALQRSSPRSGVFRLHFSITWKESSLVLCTYLRIIKSCSWLESASLLVSTESTVTVQLTHPTENYDETFLRLSSESIALRTLIWTKLVLLKISYISLSGNEPIASQKW